MGWLSDKVATFSQVPNPCFTMHITGKFLFGVGLGVLLATWLPMRTGSIFIIVALVIAIPGARIVPGSKIGSERK